MENVYKILEVFLVEICDVKWVYFFVILLGKMSVFFFFILGLYGVYWMYKYWKVQ